MATYDNVFIDGQTGDAHYTTLAEALGAVTTGGTVSISNATLSGGSNTVGKGETAFYIENTTFSGNTNSSASATGGALQIGSTSEAFLSNVSFINNATISDAGSHAGAVYISGATVNMTDVYFEGNTGRRGALATGNNSELYLTGATFKGNTSGESTSYGGLFVWNKSKAYVKDSEFLTVSDVIFVMSGGSLDMTGDITLAATLKTVVDDAATIHDADMKFINSSSISVSKFVDGGNNTLYFDNSATVSFSSAQTLNLKSITIGANAYNGVLAKGFAGVNDDVKYYFGTREVSLGSRALAADNKFIGKLTLSGSATKTLTYEETYLTISGTASETDVRFTTWDRAMAKYDGYSGYVQFTGTTTTVANADFSNNTDTKSSSCLYVDGKSLVTVDNVTFANNVNTAANGASCIRVNGSTAHITNCTFTGNTAQRGAIQAVPYTTTYLTVDNCTFSGNESSEATSYAALFLGRGNSNAEVPTIAYSVISNCSFLTQTDCIFVQATAVSEFTGKMKFAANVTVNGELTVRAADIEFINTDSTVSFGKFTDGGNNSITFAGKKVNFSSQTMNLESITIADSVADGVVAEGISGLNSDVKVVVNGKETTFGGGAVSEDGHRIDSLAYGSGKLTLSSSDTLTVNASATANAFTYKSWNDAVAALPEYKGNVSIIGGNNTIADHEFSGNTRSAMAAALSVTDGAVLTLTDVTFKDNCSLGFDNSSGAVYVAGAASKLYIDKAYFSGNTGMRGTVEVGNGFAEISGATFNGNTSAESAQYATVFVWTNAEAVVKDSQFLTSTDTIWLMTGGKLTLTGDLTINANVNSKAAAENFVVKDADLIFNNTSAINFDAFTSSGSNSMTFNGAKVSFAEQVLDLGTITIGNNVSGVVASGVAGLNDDVKITFRGKESYLGKGGVVNADKQSISFVDLDGTDLEIMSKATLTIAPDAAATATSFKSWDDAMAVYGDYRGHVYFDGGNHTVKNMTFSGNTNSCRGAAFEVRNGSVVTFNDVNFADNYTDANESASSIFIAGATANVSNATFTGNTAARGAIGVHSGGLLNLSDATFNGDHSPTTGYAGLFVYAGGTANVRNTAWATASDSLFVMNGGFATLDGTITINGRITNRGNLTFASDVNAVISGAVFENHKTIDFAGNITLNVSLSSGSNAVYNFATGTNIIIGKKGIALGGADFSNATITVNGADLAAGDVIATNIGKLGAFDIIGNDKLMLSVNADNKLVVMAETALESGTVSGTGANLVTSGAADTFIANRTNNADQLLTSVSGGSIDKNLIGGAFAKAEDGVAEIGNTELNIGGEADVKGQVYAGGYFYGTGTESTEVQMSVDNVNIKLDGNAKVNGNLFAGIHARAAANVKVNEISISINGGEHDRVYAGGWAEGKSYSEVGESVITVDGGKVNFIYGGGANGQGKTYVGATTITVRANAEVGTIFMSGRYGYSSTGAVELNWYGSADMKRLSGVSSAGVDNAASTTVKLFSDLTVDGIDYVDKFVLSEGVKLNCTGEFLLGNRTEAGLAEGATTFDFTTDGLTEAWDEAISGISDFEHALFSVNGGEAVAWGEGNTLALGSYTLTRTEESKDKYSISIA